MAHLYPYEVFRAGRVCRINGEPWLLIADFAELGGRIECVGIELRAYVRHREAKPAGLEGSYDSYWTGGPVSGAELPPDEEGVGRLFALEQTWHDLARHDFHAVATGAHEREAMLQPQVVDTKTLRGLGLASELERLRREIAERTNRLGPRLMEHHLAFERSQEHPNQTAIDALESASTAGRETRQAFRSGRAHPGRPPKYTRGDLVKVAEIYTRTHGNGLPAPTAAVVKELGVSHSVAGKLVMQCRKAGLLGPAKPRRAGGLLREAQQASDRDENHADEAFPDDDETRGENL